MQKINAFITGLGNNHLKKATTSSDLLLVSANDISTGFVDFEIEPYSFIERIAFAYHKVPLRYSYSTNVKNDNINRLINILFTIYNIKQCDENVHAFIDAWFDKRHERRQKIAEDFWKNFKYDMNDVDRAITAFKKDPLEGYVIFNHQLDALDHDIIVRIIDIIRFFHFDQNDEIINRVMKILSKDEYRKSISVSQYRGVWIVKKLNG